jgi:deferrochelatase/peroxidase EfeB
MSAVRPAEAADIQGLLWAGYGSLPEAAFLLLRIADPQAARAWLREARVSTVADLEARQATALQIALSGNGLRNLGIPRSTIQAFAPEFLSGMAGEEARSRRLGDVGPNAPDVWSWGGTGEPDILLLLYADTGKLATWKAELTATIRQSGFDVIAELRTTQMDGKEPFGFTDGVSQPRIDWEGKRKPESVSDSVYGNLISIGEFLLGYPNEYGLYTERPLLPGTGSNPLPSAEEQPGLRDLGRNGTYLVLRELHQDVRGFWRFLAARAGREGADALAEAMVGRRRSGDPLIAAQPEAIRGVGPEPDDVSRNQFTYDADPGGTRCPLGAHVRRANPRTGDLPGGRQGWLPRLLRTLGLPRSDLRSDLVASSRFHRILRRGREFGTWIEPDAAMRPGCPDPQSGLHFICLNANISRQFEFVQNAWLASAKFDGLSDESDPLTGNRAPLPSGQATDCFSMPQANGVARRLQAVPAFVTVRGGGYFFLPGVRALRFLAR